MSNVVEMGIGLIGPKRQGHDVIVDDRLIPRLHAHDRGDMIEFVLDRRFSFTFPRNQAYLAASFAAQAMAIGAGYSHIGAERPGYPFAPQVLELPSVMPDR